jgi:hypothetical protein
MSSRLVAFTLLALAAAVFVVIRTIDVPAPAVPAEWRFVPGSVCLVRMTAFRQTQAVTGFRPERETADRVTVRVDQIGFGNHVDPAESAFAKFGLRRNFYADFFARFSLEQAQEISFSVFSDDGFILRIDGERIAEFSAERAYAETQAVVRLAEGEHSLELDYFQADGYIGLDAYYRVGESRTPHFVGEDAEELTFLEPGPAAP